MIRIERPHCYLTIIQPDPGHERLIATLVLNRPDRANAFNAAMIEQLTELTSLTAQYDELAALLVVGAGKHFSAGADLEWMQSSAQLSQEQNLHDARKLSNLMETLNHIACPTLAVVSGSAFGGAVGLVGACDFAIAAEDARFCLSEVKVGLLPAVILPYLGRKMQYGELLRLGLGASVFSGKDAVRSGLVQLAVAREGLWQAVRDQLACLLFGAPKAQRQLKSLLRSLRANRFVQSDATVEAIAAARASDEGQAGLGAFLRKEKPPFVADDLSNLALDELSPGKAGAVS